MHAAVVRSFSRPPRYEEVDPPQGDLVVEVLAAGLHPRVRSSADGSHYTSEGKLPLIPGIDGVGRTPDGGLVYFVLPDTTLGSMAERTAIDGRRCVALPAGADPGAIVEELPALAAEISAGTFTVNAATVPLSEVEATWGAPAAGMRVVFTP